ncbi:MAG: caspase family protein, partial [Candidatus Eremiobacteraeota bacterium]|nr:caspase family protein [Candidatus Eremiobacteraeota bacterium]
AAATTAAATSPSAFDGTWAVTLTCLVAADGALGYTYHFSARVRNGTLHGEHGTEQQASWLVIDGRIEPDGSSMLNAHGLTGSPQYAVGRVAPLTAYAYHVTAHFDAARGTGTRVELRPCTLLFEKS